MDLAVFLHEHIDLFGVGIPVERQERRVAGIGVVFDQLHDDIILIEVPAGSAVPQGLHGQPAGEIGAQPGVAEIELRCFDQALQFVVGVWLQQIHHVHVLQDGKPLFRRGLRDPCCLAQRSIIDQIPDQSSAGADETLEGLHVFDPLVIDGIGDQVVVEVGLVIGLCLLRGRVLHINIAALPDVFKHVVDVIVRQQRFSALQTRHGEIQGSRVQNACFFPLGQPIQMQDAKTACQGFLRLFHDFFALRAGQPELPPQVAFVT